MTLPDKREQVKAAESIIRAGPSMADAMFCLQIQIEALMACLVEKGLVSEAAFKEAVKCKEAEMRQLALEEIEKLKAAVEKAAPSLAAFVKEKIAQQEQAEKLQRTRHDAASRDPSRN